MNLDYVFPHIDLPNEELTSEAQKNEVLTTYKNWLIENGCIFPSVIYNQLEFPVAFGDYGVIGTRALEDLPSLKVSNNQAFLFVPLEVIICPQKAKSSEINEVLTTYPKLFKSHSRWADYILWVYILYEKLKGPASFFHPYFAAIGESEMLMDWSMSEKMELQDKFLVFESKKQEKTALFYYESLVEVFKAFPQFFPDNDLQKNFFWAYKMVTTRSFSHGEGMVIPLADNLNHEDVYVDYLTLSSEFLNRKAADESEMSKDYRDFKGFAYRFNGKTKFRTHRNRLEKLVERMPDADFGFLKHVWQVDELLSGFESSSDEEEFVDESESEESEEEGEEEEEEEEESSVEEPVNTNIEGKYFVMRTGAEGSYLKGTQVFNCYGRLNNTDLLNEYGFCLLPNRYDSLYVRVSSK